MVGGIVVTTIGFERITTENALAADMIFNISA